MGLRILIKGACVGLDCIIKPEHRGLLDQSTLQVACLTFAEVQTVSRETIFGIAENFPKAKVHLHWAARRALFRACVRRACPRQSLFQPARLYPIDAPDSSSSPSD